MIGAEAYSGKAEKYIILGLRYFFGGHALMSGLNHFVQFIPEIMPKSPEVAVTFMSVLIETHLFDLIKIIEILCGLALITGYFVPLGLILEMPITVIICYLSLFIAPTARSIYTGPREVILNLLLLAVYWDQIKPFLCQPRMKVSPIWRSQSRRISEEGSPR